MSLLRSLFPPTVLTIGFAASLSVWCAWFLTHLPWLGLSEMVAKPVVLGVWLGALMIGAVLLRRAGRTGGETTFATAAAGLISASLGLLILGSKLTEPAGAAASMTPAELRPHAALMTLGFLVLGGVLGLVGAGLAALTTGVRRVAIDSQSDDALWIGRFGVVAAASLVPLLVIGGLVTSTNSGMAVPDWPNTFGSNMFLYPLGPRAAPDVFLEHSHRLFGALIGLTAIALTFLTFIHPRAHALRVWAVVLLVLVIVQGTLGGLRVRLGATDFASDDKFYRVIHGVLAQVVFALFVVVAVLLSPLYQSVRDRVRRGELAFLEGGLSPRMFRIFANAALHTTFLQLIFGALYRHTRQPHALWTHIGFSVVVLVLALVAASAATSVRPDDARARTTLSRWGILAASCVFLQFALGWVAFIVGGSSHQAESIPQALIRTSHQANGALLVAILTVLAVWSKMLAPKVASLAVPQARLAPGA